MFSAIGVMKRMPLTLTLHDDDHQHCGSLYFEKHLQVRLIQNGEYIIVIPATIGKGCMLIKCSQRSIAPALPPLAAYCIHDISAIVNESFIFTIVLMSHIPCLLTHLHHI